MGVCWPHAVIPSHEHICCPSTPTRLQPRCHHRRAPLGRGWSSGVRCRAGDASKAVQTCLPIASWQVMAYTAIDLSVDAEKEKVQATRLRVERQVHLPASRDEAWLALQSLVHPDHWNDSAHVFSALENIYRTEFSIVSQELQRSYRAANEALEVLNPLEELSSGSEASSSYEEASLEEEGPLSTSSGAMQRRSDGNGLPEVAGDQEDGSRGGGDSSSSGGAASSRQASSSTSNGVSTNGQTGQRGGSSSNSRTSASNGKPDPGGSEDRDADAGIHQAMGQLEKGDPAAGDRLGKAAKQGLSWAQKQAKGALDPQSASGGSSPEGQPPSRGASKSAAATMDQSSEQQQQQQQQQEIITQGSVDFEDASRLEFDRKRHAELLHTGLQKRVDPAAADRLFIRLLVNVLNKAHFLQLSARDDALSRSLNSDYLAQLYISADVKNMDEHLFSAVSRDAELPPEAKTLLVFKRGFGQARRKGRMLVPKLDYLQYLVAKRVITAVGNRVIGAWRRVRGVSTEAEEQAAREERTARAGQAERGPGVGQTSVAEEDDRLKAASKKKRKEERAGKRDDEPQQQSAAVLARGRLGHAVRDWFSPRLMVAGGGLFMSLSRWGILPSSDVLPLSDFNKQWTPQELDRQAPVYVERVSLRDALQGTLQNPRSLLNPIELVEPTFQELLVVFRRTAPRNWVSEVKAAVLGDAFPAKPQLRRRSPICLRAYRDIPVPTWRIVFPDKLLQFRPLDGLRSDLFSAAGLVSFIAQAQFDSIILEAITFASAIVLATRVVLGYKRMNDRFEQLANELLADSTLAGQEGTLQYLSACAALQQWAQAALALLVLGRAGRALSEPELQQQAEELLEEHFQVKVFFNAPEAVQELLRLHQRLAQNLPTKSEKLSIPSAGVCLALLQVEQSGGPEQGAQYQVVAPQEGLKQLREHWDGLLLLPRTEEALEGAALP